MLGRQGKAVLRALVEGSRLRRHSDLDGVKRYALEDSDGADRPVDAWTVFGLQARGLVLSNDKFPASTFVLTEKGLARASRLSAAPLRPVQARLTSHE